MKKILYIICVIAVLPFASCTDNFEPEIYGELSSSNFPTTPEEYKLYMLDLYKPFFAQWGYGTPFGWVRNFYSPEHGYIVQNDASSDMMPNYAAWGGLWDGYSKSDFTFLKTEGRSSHFEKVRDVAKATKIIDDIEKADLNQAYKDLLTGEARMARGAIMYYLLWMYGPLPVITDPALIGTEEESNLTRPARDSYVSNIESDLRFAADHLPRDAEDYGRFNKGCALTFLTRLYMNEKNWAKAESTARELMTLNYELVDNYASLFKEATEINNETIWAISCNNANETNFNPTAFYCYPFDYPGQSIQGGWGAFTGAPYSIDWTFYDTFEDGDARKALLIPEYVAKDGTLKNRDNMFGAVIAKYLDEGAAKNTSQGNDFVVCRYADILLMLAEAINEQNGPTAEAIDLVNQIRNRSDIANLSAEDVASADSFRDALFLERGHELYLEGLRRVDMIRMGKWGGEEHLNALGKRLGPSPLYPVPEYAINNSEGKLTQTPGY